ncbi:hypothetical protein BBF96_05485 [Anoxybacter fermentans]|uniref:Uncharacterized protein n=1 Tax=Anoxybacter fermentans TaxID=1323375 RepID=A0A3S9SX65_9FIRM|nr:tetratricopeptide repeat protein [Anoxybacter fermentans]AZR72889.1 hypothetical protein BBF96_05485 [Anoxybacter fermentans]
MERKLCIIFLIILIIFSSGCTYRASLISSGKDALIKGDLVKAEAIFKDLLSFSPHNYEGYLYLGFIYLYRDRFEDAIHAFQTSIQYNEQPDLEYLGLGQAYLAIKDYDKARTFLEKAREVANYPVTEYLLGFIYLNEGDQYQAKKALSTASKFYPDRGEIWAVLGKLFLENLQPLDAAQAYQMAYIYGIRNYGLYTGLAESYYQLGNFRQAIALTEQALKEKHISPEEKEQLRLKLAQYNMNQNPSKAIESLETILKNKPDKAEVLLMLGQLYFQQEMYQKALNTFEQYLKKYPPLVTVLHIMYRSHLALGNYKLAEKYLLYTIDLNPDQLSYYLELINLYQREKRWADVVKVYKQALELSPDNLDLLTNLSAVYFKLKDYDKALPYLERAIELQPTNIELYLIKANVYYKLKQIDKEIATYETILQITPDHLLAINNLAQIYRDTDRLDQAFSLYKKARNIDPNDGRYDRNLGYILLLKGDYIQAREYLMEAITKNPDDYEAYRFLADTYYALDQYKEAVKYYKKSLQIKPDYYYAMYPLGKAYFYLNEFKKAKPYFEAYLKRYPLNEGSKFYLTRIAWLENQKNPDFEVLPAEPQKP